MAKYIDRYAHGEVKPDECYVHFGHRNEGFPLSIVQAGYHQTRGGYGYGPMIRDHWLLHFVEKGSGVVWVENMKYEVKESQIFAIRPHQITYYEADKNDPWEYYYVGFRGDWARQVMKDIGFLDENSIVIRIPDPDPVLTLLKEVRKYVIMYLQEGDGALGIYGCIYEIFQILNNSRHEEQAIQGWESEELHQHEYTKTLISIIDSSFSQKISIQELANQLHLNRSYMSELFAKDMGISVKSYLTDIRMQRAAIMLQSPHRNIKNVAENCGFDDSLYFSKVFKQYFGISPKEYQKKMKENE